MSCSALWDSRAHKSLWVPAPHSSSAPPAACCCSNGAIPESPTARGTHTHTDRILAQPPFSGFTSQRVCGRRLRATTWLISHRVAGSNPKARHCLIGVGAFNALPGTIKTDNPSSWGVRFSGEGLINSSVWDCRSAHAKPLEILWSRFQYKLKWL